ncbi:hypothetical protein VTL71DRAFT_10216 [Oculimacula yallundae]|uniref:C2H2-type domain-containing protein n=1 Tax=Oculimacula yallundae TaxID=86028 RepID=A0ABR4BPK0_9HELO
MDGESLRINCGSCPSFEVSVSREAPKDAIKAAEFHIEGRKSLSRVAGPSSSTRHSDASTMRSYMMEPSRTSIEPLKAILDDLCTNYSPKSSISVKYTHQKSPTCEIKCEDCTDWSFTSLFSPPYSSKSETHLNSFRHMAKQHLQSKEHKAARQTGGARTVVQYVSPRSLSSVNRSSNIQLEKVYREDHNKAASQQKHPAFATEIEQARKIYQSTFPECAYCKYFYKSILDLSEVPSNLQQAYKHACAPSQKTTLNKALSKVCGMVLTARTVGDDLEIGCKFCTGIITVRGGIGQGEGWDAEMAAAKRHIADPAHIARERSANQATSHSAHPGRTTSSVNPSTDSPIATSQLAIEEPSIETRLLAVSQKHFPEQASLIQKAWLRYTNEDLDNLECGECYAAFGDLSMLDSGHRGACSAEQAASGVEHVLEHVLGGDVEGDGNDEQDEDDEDEEEESEDEDESEITSILIFEPAAVLPPSKSRAQAPNPSAIAHDSLTPLKIKYPSSSFSLQRNERNEECFTCHDCNRTLSSGACFRNYEQHLGSVAHRKIVDGTGA